MIGETIGHYRIIERLGAGGMGEVFLAEDVRLHRQAAIKIIAEHLTRDEPRRQRFVQEARLAAAIDHPNIAAIYDIDESGDRTYIAMEYVAGETLRHVLQRGPLDPSRAVDLALQVASALAKVHERGVIHRDLKPDNVIISSDGYAKIIDFGLAKLTEPEVAETGVLPETTHHTPPKTEEGLVLGTVPYMSPEQARGRPLDPRSDIFSFGALLYETLTAKSAFRRSTAMDTLGAVLTEEPPAMSLKDITFEPDLRRILAKCLQKKVDARYQSMRQVETDLRRVKQAIDRRAAGQGVRPPWMTIRVLAAGAMILLAAVAVVVWITRRAPDAGIPTTGPATGSAALAVGSRPAVAILAFDGAARTVDRAWLAKGFPSMLALALGQGADIEIVGRARLHDAARAAGHDSFDNVDGTAARSVAKRAGAGFVLRGGILPLGEDVTIDTRLEDAATGKELFAETVRGRDPLTMVNELSARLRTRLGRSPAGARQLSDISSASIDAMHAYADGLDALDRWKTVEATRQFDRAVRSDSLFSLAYLSWAIADDLDGRHDDARAHLTRALQHEDRLSARDRLDARGRLAAAEGRFDEARKLDEQLLGAYPDAERTYFAEAELVRAPSGPLQDPAATVELFTRAIGALPASPALHGALGSAFWNVGRFDDAKREIEAAVQLDPRSPAPLETLADEQFVASDPATAIETYRRAIKGGAESARSGLGWALASLGRYDEALDADRARGFSRAFLLSRAGRLREADQTLRAALLDAERDRDVELATALVTLEALTAYEVGNCGASTVHLADAAARIGGAADLVKSRWMRLGQLIHAACDARSGKAQGAPSNVSQPPTARLPFERTGIALPLSIFGQCLPFRDGSARALLAQGKTTEAIAAYRRLVTPPPTGMTIGVLEPRHVLALARVLANAGQHDAARVEYRRFLDLWRHADPDRPELAEARRGSQ